MKTTLLAAGLLAAASFAGAANAGTFTAVGTGGTATVTATNATGATSFQYALTNFGNANTNGLVYSTTTCGDGSGNFAPSNCGQPGQGATVTFTPNTTTPMAGVYDGNVQGVTASAFNGTGLSPRNYLVAEPNDPVNINYNNARNTFALLWGTVDTYNSLSLNFLNAAGASLGNITIGGAQVEAAAGISDGNTPAFVVITTTTPFTAVQATSTTAAFEFVPARVPEPASLALVGAGLAGLGLIRRRRKTA